MSEEKELKNMNVDINEDLLGNENNEEEKN